MNGVALPFVDLDWVLGPGFRIEHRMRRGVFEKRIVVLDEARFVLYRFASPWLAQRLVWLLERGESLGIPLQRPLARTGHWREAVRQRGWWVAASYEPGEPLTGGGTLQSLGALGRALAAFHRLERTRPGPLLRMMPLRGGFLHRLYGELGRALAIACPERPGQHSCRRWLERHGMFIAGLPVYQLTHGDLYGRNILVRPGGIALIDYELAAFEPAGLELGTALLRAFCAERSELRESLLRGYLAECSPNVRAVWEANHGFFLVAAALRLAQKRAFRAGRLKKLGQPAEPAWQQAVRYGTWARAMLEALQQQEETSVDSLLQLCT